MEKDLQKAAPRKRPKILGATGRGQPYLWLRPGRVGSDGVERGAIWIIKHAGRQHATGCGSDESAIALQKLDEYKLSLYRANTEKGLPANRVLIADALARYLDYKVVGTRDDASIDARDRELAQRVTTLLEWWGDRSLGDIDTGTCAAYSKSRVGQPWKVHARKIVPADGETARRRSHLKPTKDRVTTIATARRELEDLRAAALLSIADGYCREAVKVTLPDKPDERDRWLTKSEAARLVMSAWRKREVQKGHVTDRYACRHLVKFLLIGLRTGTRSTAICQASFIPEIGKPWVELYEVGGVKAAKFHRKALGADEAKNKKYPTVRLPDSLAAWMHRWHHVDGCRYVVQYRGGPVGSTKKSFANLVYELGLGDDVIRHTLRHTAATWGMQQGVDVWQLAGYLGMTVETLERRYGHHSPDHMEQARKALGGGSKRGRNAA